MKSINYSSGFSLVEVLISVAILGIALVPAMNALQTSLKAAEIHNSAVTQYYHVSEKIEEVLAKSYSDLDTQATAAGGSSNPSSYSDASGPDQRQVYLSRYDGDNADADNDPFTGTEADLMWVRVELVNSNIALETITTP